mmetsp:Transcript_10576/g.32897  ORF Transcript_10576/g.32897 Transcript_10576/m.32897 type:complete len:260 (+) Transcript_10576:49-828(+)
MMSSCSSATVRPARTTAVRARPLLPATAPAPPAPADAMMSSSDEPSSPSPSMSATLPTAPSPPLRGGGEDARSGERARGTEDGSPSSAARSLSIRRRASSQVRGSALSSSPSSSEDTSASATIESYHACALALFFSPPLPFSPFFLSVSGPSIARSRSSARASSSRPLTRNALAIARAWCTTRAISGLAPCPDLLSMLSNFLGPIASISLVKRSLVSAAGPLALGPTSLSMYAKSSSSSESSPLRMPRRSASSAARCAW